MPAHKVYRSGPVTVPVHPPVIARLYASADAVRPPGRVGRADALFCSPTLFGVSRWFRANLMVGGRSADVGVREIRLSPSVPVYAYEVKAWDRASHDGSTAADMRAFWASGIRLEDWFAGPSRDPREWEVLVPRAAVRGVTPVADARVVGSIPADDWTRDELVRELKRFRRR